METCCGYRYDRRALLPPLSRAVGHGRTERALCHSDVHTAPPANLIPRCAPPLGRTENSPRPSRRRRRARIVASAARAGAGTLAGFPFAATPERVCSTQLRFPLRIGSPRTTLLFAWNPAPLQSSRLPREYLLLPPRSALGAAFTAPCGSAAPQPPRPAYPTTIDPLLSARYRWCA